MSTSGEINVTVGGAVWVCTCALFHVRCQCTYMYRVWLTVYCKRVRVLSLADVANGSGTTSVLASIIAVQ